MLPMFHILSSFRHDPRKSLVIVNRRARARPRAEQPGCGTSGQAAGLRDERPDGRVAGCEWSGLVARRRRRRSRIITPAPARTGNGHPKHQAARRLRRAARPRLAGWR
ncbi:hypothetical protein Apa02nite_002890 [Actinoplanes palleronii]|uniref:Uncharacterized protein n=1 Tax=Actinoplanes palleronii TaxID=113570 RepID=A0ABQ4B124_9ACTN|nr:hypothetical protein Apa02nite_002890 [Actinoplanes palleronii]